MDASWPYKILRCLFSNMMAKASRDFAERQSAPPPASSAVFIYTENADIYVSMCLVYLDRDMTDEMQPVVEARKYPRSGVVVTQMLANHHRCCSDSCP